MSQVTPYVIVTPVKDEVQFVEKTLKSVAAQTIKPLLWVIVDDGSQDGTLGLVSSFAATHPWIKVLALAGDRPRRPGSAVIQAFQAGLEALDDVVPEFIVKLDGDLELPPNYFEYLLKKFAEDPLLGIASGAYFERDQGRAKLIEMPHYHAAGASKVVRARCFYQINGFIASRGWDTVDEIRAQVYGWKTTNFPDLQLEHLKPEGTGIGRLRTNYMHGEIYYLTGGGSLFLFLKAIHRAVRVTPWLVGALALLLGFFNAQLRRRPRLVSEVEARHYQNLLMGRISATVHRIFAKLNPSATPRSSF